MRHLASCILLAAVALASLAPALPAQAGRRSTRTTSPATDPRDDGSRDRPVGAHVYVIAWLEETAAPGGPNAAPPPRRSDEPRFPSLGEMLGEDYDKVAQGKGGEARRPTWTYYFKGSDEGRARFEERLFEKPDVVLASRFFKCVRVDLDKLPADDPRHRTIERVPCFTFQDANGDLVATQAGATTPEALLRRLDEGFVAQYEGKVLARVARIRKVQEEVDRTESRIAALRSLLVDLELVIADEDRASLLRRRDQAKADLAAAEARLPAAMQELQELQTPVVSSRFVWKHR